MKLTLIFLFLSLASTAQAAAERQLLALSKGAHTLSIVDVGTLKVVATIPVGPDPHEVVASSDGKTAYVSNTGGGSFHEINVIDLVAKKPSGNLDTGALIGPHGLAFADEKLWFTAEGAKSIGRYDPKTARIDWILGTGQERTHMLEVSTDAKKVFATNVDSGTVSVLENVMKEPPLTPMNKHVPSQKAKMGWTQTIIPTHEGSEGFDVTPDGAHLWTVTPRTGEIFVIETATKKVVHTIKAKILGANRLRFTPDGKRALIASLLTGDVFVYDVAKRALVKKVNVGSGAAGLLVDADGSRAFIGCTPDDYIAVLDLKKLEVTSHIDVGARPDGLAWQ